MNLLQMALHWSSWEPFVAFAKVPAAVDLAFAVRFAARTMVAAPKSFGARMIRVARMNFADYPVAAIDFVARPVAVVLLNLVAKTATAIARNT